MSKGNYQLLAVESEKPTQSYSVIAENDDISVIESLAKKHPGPTTIYDPETNRILGGYGWESDPD